jgi:23S rRNA (adenine-N6)-dimethyltransferase
MSRRPFRTPRAEALSQHRLRDDTVAERIVASTGLAPPSLVVEAGAGDGVLTAAIARHAGRVIAVEQDRDCYRALRQRFGSESRVTPVLADFLAFELPARPYHVVSNVPYAITSQVVRKLLDSARPPRSAFLVVQREAALRWTGDGGECIEGVLAKVHFEFEIVLALRRQDFVPWPRVSSVVLAIRRRPRPVLGRNDAVAFARFVERGFGRGRGTVRQNLGKAARRRDIDLDVPPRELSFEQWLRLFRC